MTQPVVLITGCSSGIGRALADAFKGAGYRVFAAARKGADLEALNAAGFTAVKLDVNDAEDIARASERVDIDISHDALAAGVACPDGQWRQIVTIEDSCIAGGAGSAVAEWCAANGYAPKCLHLGLPDAFIDQGDVNLIYQRLGLDAESVASKVRQFVA